MDHPAAKSCKSTGNLHGNEAKIFKSERAKSRGVTSSSAARVIELGSQKVEGYTGSKPGPNKD